MAELDEQLNQPSEAERRITDLSSTVKKTSEERDAEKAAREAAEAKAAAAERKAEALSGFADVVAENPAAKDHKDDILSKVESGYTLEDATFAVLGKAGKLNAPTHETSSPAGGSAATVLPSNTPKTIGEMSQEERRQAIIDAEARGDIGTS